MNNAETLKLLTPLEIGGVMGGLTTAEGAALDRMESAIVALAEEIFPSTCHDTISAWERVYDLKPAEDATLSDRRLAVLRKVRAVGGYSRAYFIALAAVYGQIVTITEYVPPQCGIARCGDSLVVAEAKFMWTVHGLTAAAEAARCGSICCGERLSKLGAGIESMFEELKPAHTIVNFVYDGN